MNMKKLAKKWIALTMAGALVLSAPVVAMGDPGTANSTGSSTGHMDKDIVNVTLPTAAARQFDFVADPERLIDEATSGDAINFRDSSQAGTTNGYTVTTNDNGFYFYVKSGDNDVAFANTSDPIRIINNSAIDVDMTFKAEVKTQGNFKISTSEDIKNSTGDATLYLAVGTRTDTGADFAYSDDTALKALTVGSTLEVPVTLTGGDENYKAVLSGTTTEYKYEIKPDIQTDDTTAWKYAEFNMKGACSKSTVTGTTAAPEFEITWSFKKHTDAYVSSTTISRTSNSVTVSLPEGVTVSGVKLTKAAGGDVALASGTHYTVSGNTYSLDAGMLGNHVGGKITFTFSDSKTEVLSIN